MGATCCTAEECLKNEKDGVTEITGRPSPNNNANNPINLFNAGPNVSVLSMDDATSNVGVNTMS